MLEYMYEIHLYVLNTCTKCMYEIHLYVLEYMYEMHVRNSLIHVRIHLRNSSIHARMPVRNFLGGYLNWRGGLLITPQGYFAILTIISLNWTLKYVIHSDLKNFTAFAFSVTWLALYNAN